MNPPGFLEKAQSQCLREGGSAPPCFAVDTKGASLELELLQRVVGIVEPQMIRWGWAVGVKLHKAHSSRRQREEKPCVLATWRSP